MTPFSVGCVGTRVRARTGYDVPGRVRRSRATAERHPREHGRTAPRADPRHRPHGDGRRPRVDGGPAIRPAAQPLLAPPASSCRGRPILLVGGPTRSRWPHGIPSFRSTQTCSEARRGAAASPPRRRPDRHRDRPSPGCRCRLQPTSRTCAMQQMFRLPEPAPALPSSSVASSAGGL